MGIDARAFDPNLNPETFEDFVQEIAREVERTRSHLARYYRLAEQCRELHGRAPDVIEIVEFENRSEWASRAANRGDG